MITRRHFANWIAAGAVPLALGAAMFDVAAPGIAAAQERDDDPKAWPNVFISPFGQPFRAKEDAPYPVGAWFKQADKNADGKIDHAEFMADAAFFFDALDINKDGVLDGAEVQRYEQRIAPEILGYRVQVTGAGAGKTRMARAAGLYGGQLWLVQGGGPEPGVTSVLPPGAGREPSGPRIPHSIDESRNGASPFSFFDQPEPVTAADLEFTGFIKKKNFLRLAGVHFQSLDHKEQGYLTLDGLPKTFVQQLLARGHRRG
jgi:hypothetical protein